MDIESRIKHVIRDVPDFPKPGILFKDITPIMEDPGLCEDITAHLAATWSREGLSAVVGIESRGFFWGFGLAQKLNVPFVPVRKAGKLPAKTIGLEYDLEYGSATIEIHADAIKQGQRILLHDDLLATGGTAKAAGKLIKKTGGEVAGYSFLIELSFLNGRNQLDEPVKTIVSY